MAVYINSYNSSPFSNAQLHDIVVKNFDLRPGMLIKTLNLKDPIYQSTSVSGHFGRKGFKWEDEKAIEMPEELKNIKY